MNGATSAPQRGASGRFDSLRAGPKIVLVVTVMALVTLATGGVALARIGVLDSKLQLLKSTNIARLNHLVELEGSIAAVYRGMYLFIGTHAAAAELPWLRQGLLSAETTVETTLAAYRSTPDRSSAWQTQVNRFTSGWTRYQQLLNTIILGEPAPPGVAIPTTVPTIITEFDTAEGAMNGAVATLRTSERTQADATAHDAGASARTTLVSVLLAGLLIAVTMAVLVDRSIARRMGRVRATLSDGARMVADSSHQLSAFAKALADNVEDTSAQTSILVHASEEVSGNVQAVAEATQEIGNVVQVITSIAEQTHLLALNATVEAARAGEAGMGFAVVANEVQDLAQETVKASEGLSRRVGAIQADTDSAVAATEQISGIIAQINARQRLTTTIGDTVRSAEDLTRRSGDLETLVARFTG